MHTVLYCTDLHARDRHGAAPTMHVYEPAEMLELFSDLERFGLSNGQVVRKTVRGWTCDWVNATALAITALGMNR